MHASRATVPLARLTAVWPPRRAPRVWEIGRARLWLGGLAFAALLYFGAPAFFNWKHVVSSSGGRYFVHRTVIPVAPFAQDDPRWGDQLLGNTIDTLGQQGCAVTSAAMIMRAYGVDTDPQRLNDYLTTHGGYVGDGWIVWEKAAAIAGGQVEKAYEDAPSYALLDANILKGNPVIVRLTLRHGENHFVVVVGKQGWDYLIRDPARTADWGVYPLRKVAGRIEALRFFRVVPPPPVLAVRPGVLAGIPAASASVIAPPVAPVAAAGASMFVGPPVPTTITAVPVTPVAVVPASVASPTGAATPTKKKHRSHAP